MGYIKQGFQLAIGMCLGKAVYDLGRVHISVRTRLLGKFLPSSMLKILEVRQYICEFSP